MSGRVTNIIIAGLGGQGVLTASAIVSAVAFGAGFDVKQSDLHGMSQRGGSVSSDIRFGREVFSPMVPAGQADFLIVVAPDQVEVNRHRLGPKGLLIEPGAVDETQLATRRSINIALLGILSCHLGFPESAWLGAIRATLPEKLHAANLSAFALGRGRA